MVESAADGDADRRRGPDRGRRCETHDEALVQHDHARAEEADARDDLRRHARHVHANRLRGRLRLRGEDGREVEPVEGHDHEQARAERDQVVRAQAGLLGAELALQTDQRPEEGGEGESPEKDSRRHG